MRLSPELISVELDFLTWENPASTSIEKTKGAADVAKPAPQEDVAAAQQRQQVKVDDSHIIASYATDLIVRKVAISGRSNAWDIPIRIL